MRRLIPLVITVGLVVSGCQSPATPPAAPQVETNDSGPSQSDASSDDTSGAAPAPSACANFDPASLEWFELGLGDSQPISTDAGVTLQISRTNLPSTSAERYNTIVEVCPGFHLANTFDGQTVLLSIAEDRYALAAPLRPAGSLDNPQDPGVIGGGPTWGFRDSLVVGDELYLSDGIIDLDAQCVAVGVHRVALGDVLGTAPATSDLVYRSEPCVSYTDNYRGQAPLKVHLGGALAYSESDDELYLSIGDLHMGASRISQAEAIGIDNLESDYALLGDPDAAVSAVVGIANPSSSAQARIVAKGLRNSMGMTVVRTNRLWLTDHGPQGGDELNLIEDGGDYGWPLTSEGTPYDRTDYSADADALLAPWLDILRADIPGTIDPASSWTPAIAPSAIVQYPDTAGGIDGWDGDLVIATLRAQSLVHLSLTPESTIDEDRLRLGERIRDMIVTPNGQFVMVTDSSKLLVVAP